MKTDNDNWWTDPKNKEEVERISWWDHPENQHEAKLPISLVETDRGAWIASTNSKTEALLGKLLTGVAQGNTKEEAINHLLRNLKFISEFDRDRSLRYARWVPFRRGPWWSIGGTWFVIFGIHVYFRYGKKMKYGWYVPMTKLNISIHSEWATYRNYKRSVAGGGGEKA